MVFKGWEKIEIETEQGNRETAIAPVIISASRSTDIPAFYSEWFANRLSIGYCKWVNPFNRRPQHVSFQNARFVIFWSKNPAPILDYLPLLTERGIGWYIQFTLNDYEAENFEPNVPSLEQRIETFAMLSEKWGKNRVIWRFDPLILTEKLGIEKLLGKIQGIGDQIHPFTEKLVISFVDISNYAKVKRNLKTGGVRWHEFTPQATKELAEGAASLAKSWGLQVATCGAGVDLNEYGIIHNRCIDDELMMRIASSDKKLRSFLGYGGGGGSLFGQIEKKHPMKDKGQRKECGCIVSKDIGQYNTCEHLCIYCYANTSAAVVQRNRNLVSSSSETIIPE